MKARLLAAAFLLVAAASLRAQDLIVEGAAPDDPLATRATRLFRDDLAAVESRLGARLGEPAPRLVLVSNEAELARRVAEHGGRPPPAWALAIAIPAHRVMAIRVDRLRSSPTAFLDPTVRHELGHLVLGAVAARSGHRLPRWLDEGLAQLAEDAAFSRDDELELGAAARFDTLETFAQLERDFPPHAAQAERAYRVCLGFARFLDRKPGGVRALVARLDAGASAEEALRAHCGMSAGEAEAEWKIGLAERSSIFESLFRSAGFWSGVVSVLALLAIARYVISSRRLKRRMERAEAAVERTEEGEESTES